MKNRIVSKLGHHPMEPGLFVGATVLGVAAMSSCSSSKTLLVVETIRFFCDSSFSRCMIGVHLTTMDCEFGMH